VDKAANPNDYGAKQYSKQENENKNKNKSWPVAESYNACLILLSSYVSIIA
jgi:hypothetical protein